MKQSIITGLFLFLFLPFLSHAQYANSFAKPNGVNLSGFIKNKGQIIDQNNKLNPDVIYLLNTPGMNVQLRSSGWSYDVYEVETSDKPPFAIRHSQFSINKANSEQRTAKGE
jgi:hypothetical protein